MRNNRGGVDKVQSLEPKRERVLILGAARRDIYTFHVCFRNEVLAFSAAQIPGDLMRRAPRDPRIGIFTRPVASLMLLGGLWSALVNLALFSWLEKTT